MMELPCLAFYRRERSTTLFSASQQKPILAGDDTDEFLRDKTLCPATRGLLLIRDPASLATFLWSPQDRDRIRLPPLDGIEDVTLMRSQCHLSDEPSAAGCVVVVVEGGDRDHTFIRYCRPGDDRWVRHDYDIGSQPALPDPEGNEFEKTPICPITACRGKFYFNCSTTELGVLEFCPDPVFGSISIDDESCDEAEDDAASETEDEEYEYDETQAPPSNELGVLDPAFSSLSIEESCDEFEGEASEDEECEQHETRAPAQVFHVESGGELYMVTLLHVSIHDDGIAECFVEKMDFAARRWRRVDDLGGRTFFLSTFYFGASCFCGEEGGGELQPDCVYIVFSWKKEMLVFDVKEGTQSVHKLDEAPVADKAFWLLPKENE